jgi:hypothetical protein
MVDCYLIAVIGKNVGRNGKLLFNPAGISLKLARFLMKSARIKGLT